MDKKLAVAFAGLSLLALAGCAEGDVVTVDAQAHIAPVASPVVVELVEIVSSIYCDQDGTLVETVGDVTTTTPGGC